MSLLKQQAVRIWQLAMDRTKDCVHGANIQDGEHKQSPNKWVNKQDIVLSETWWIIMGKGLFYVNRVIKEGLGGGPSWAETCEVRRMQQCEPPPPGEKRSGSRGQAPQVRKSLGGLQKARQEDMTPKTMSGREWYGVKLEKQAGTRS